MTEKLFTIGTLAKQAGVNIEAIRFYQRRGLLAEPEKPLGGVRRYDDSHTRRIQFIKHGQTLGFSLTEIGELLSLEDGQHCCEAQEIALRKLATIRERMASLRKMETALNELVNRCTENSGSVTCPIIATLQTEIV
jgi:MerR family transcriptional regulator, mercuric resistance operon regulatory protein